MKTEIKFCNKGRKGLDFEHWTGSMWSALSIRLNIKLESYAVGDLHEKHSFPRSSVRLLQCGFQRFPGSAGCASP